MNKRFCSNCGHSNPWELIKPKICAKCDCDMNAAFAAATSAPVQPPAPAYAPRTGQSVRASRVIRNHRGEDITHLRVQAASQAPNQEHEYDEEGGYFDPEEADYQTQQLIASVKGQIKVNLEEAPKSVRFGDLDNVKQFIADASAAATPKAKRSRRK